MLRAAGCDWVKGWRDSRLFRLRIKDAGSVASLLRVHDPDFHPFTIKILKLHNQVQLPVAFTSLLFSLWEFFLSLDVLNERRGWEP